jgi:hypothetical protein
VASRTLAHDYRAEVQRYHCDPRSAGFGTIGIEPASKSISWQANCKSQTVDKEIEKNGWSLNALHDVELLLDGITSSIEQHVFIGDIVNQSAVWKGIRSQADRMEALRLVK